MKTTKLEKWLLLEQSGELSPHRQRLLNATPEAQAKRDELNALCAAVPALDAEPEPWTVTKIAARLREERRPVFTFSPSSFLRAGKVWKPVFLTAACLMLVVSTFDFRQTSPTFVSITESELDVWDNQFEEDLVELESLILAISGDPLDIMEM